MTKEETKSVIERLTREGAVLHKDVVVKNVTISKEPNYVRVGLTVDKDLPSYVVDKETGEYVLGTSNVIFTSTYSLSSILKENDDTAFAANYLVTNPNAFSVLLSRAKLNVLQQNVKAHTEYVNPFNGATTEFDHDVIIYNIIDIISMSNIGTKALSKIFDTLMSAQPELLEI